MALPYFYIEELEEQRIVLDEDTSKHMIGVLRMEKGEKVLLTNGKGKKATASIIDDNRKKCVVSISEVSLEESSKVKKIIAISLVKNVSRFEWFLEKATEMGVNEIIPMICQRTEKEKFRHDRMKQILTSAMLQSQQCWLPELHQPTPFLEVIANCNYEDQYIAHCLPGQKNSLREAITLEKSAIILIGPEGDFTPEEIEASMKNKFHPVALGDTRLRTETAGIVAAALFCVH
jgi:16S rRNA (uracil1498-N3)-methyltransferase